MVNYDLHVHSTYSDGVLSVKEIIDICKEKSLLGVAITDHDTVTAFSDKSFLDEDDIYIIPGIELSTSYNKQEIHILGYNIDYNNKFLLRTLNKIKEFRLNRVETIISKLNIMGYNIILDDVLEYVAENASIGRPHVARCLVNKGYFKDTYDVFERLLANGKPACVDRFKLHPKEGIDLIKNAGGIPVLAHPYVSKSKQTQSNFSIFINDMVGYGIEGIEVYHSLHSKIQEGLLLNYAIKNNLLVTGGSDCHDKYDKNGEYIIGTKGVDSYVFSKFNLVR
ncbi:MAG: PHP domain-containing protein [Clostridium sp.]